ncbi:hypothetical protein D0808_02175 [Bacillus subtilis]|nr:hypothetical protein D0808_02175 [Bacillus subtilis]
MSGKVRDYTRLAKDILEAVGGEENVIGASRCATRLRLVLKRSTPKAKDIVKSMLPSRRHYGCHGYAYKACDWPAFSVRRRIACAHRAGYGDIRRHSFFLEGKRMRYSQKRRSSC